jgi:hypothetical protein
MYRHMNIKSIKYLNLFPAQQYSPGLYVGLDWTFPWDTYFL